MKNAPPPPRGGRSALRSNDGMGRARASARKTIVVSFAFGRLLPRAVPPRRASAPTLPLKGRVDGASLDADPIPSSARIRGHLLPLGEGRAGFAINKKDEAQAKASRHSLHRIEINNHAVLVEFANGRPPVHTSCRGEYASGAAGEGILPLIGIRHFGWPPIGLNLHVIEPER